MSGKRPLRVAQVISTMTWGGAEMLLADLAGSLRDVAVEPSVTYLAELDGSPAVPRLRERGVDPVLVPMTLLHDPRGLLRLRRHLAALEPDLVHTHLGYADLLGSAAARSLGIPSVATLHVMEWACTGKDAARERLIGAARRRFASRVVAVSDAGRRAYLERQWDRPERVVTIHNGVVAHLHPGSGAEVRAELGLAPDDLVVATLSVLRPDKGHHVVIDAVTRLRARFPNLRLLVIGEGAARPNIERAAAALGDGVILTGHRDDAMRVLDAVDVLVHPSRIDAFPTALLEAMAAGVPAVATAVGGIPEIIRHGRTGVLLAPAADGEALAAALTPLLEGGDLRHDLGRQSRVHFAERFSAQRWAARLRELYDDVLAA